MAKIDHERWILKLIDDAKRQRGPSGENNTGIEATVHPSHRKLLTILSSCVSGEDIEIGQYEADLIKSEIIKIIAQSDFDAARKRRHHEKDIIIHATILLVCEGCDESIDVLKFLEQNMNRYNAEISLAIADKLKVITRG